MSFEANVCSRSALKQKRHRICLSAAWPRTDRPHNSWSLSRHWSEDGASGFCTEAKSVGRYWYSISSVTPKLLCIQRLCSKPGVSSLWPVILTTRPAVPLHNYHQVLYYPGDKSTAPATLGAVQHWHIHSASLLLEGKPNNLAITHKFAVHWFLWHNGFMTWPKVGGKEDQTDRRLFSVLFYLFVYLFIWLWIWRAYCSVSSGRWRYGDGLQTTLDWK